MTEMIDVPLREWRGFASGTCRNLGFLHSASLSVPIDCRVEPRREHIPMSSCEWYKTPGVLKLQPRTCIGKNPSHMAKAKCKESEKYSPVPCPGADGACTITVSTST